MLSCFATATVSDNTCDAEHRPKDQAGGLREVGDLRSNLHTYRVQYKILVVAHSSQICKSELGNRVVGEWSKIVRCHAISLVRCRVLRNRPHQHGMVGPD